MENFEQEDYREEQTEETDYLTFEDYANALEAKDQRRKSGEYFTFNEIAGKRKFYPKGLEDDSSKIEGSLYQYMIDNYDKVMFWIMQLLTTPTEKSKVERLKDYTHLDQNDLQQETYTRILKTFYDNEQRLIACSKCTHKCKEFLNQEKKTNTEKYVDGKTCRPYMQYNYTEKMLHNYINRAVKQNVDIKLVSLSKKPTARLNSPVNSSADACDLGSLISDGSVAAEEISRELTEQLLDKKLVFINKLAKFELEPDIFSQSTEYVELENMNYDEKLERTKAERRKIYTQYNLAVPKHLRAQPKTLKIKLDVPYVDLWEKAMARFDLVRASWEQEDFWTQDKLDEIKIQFEKSKKEEKSHPVTDRELYQFYRDTLELDKVFTDEDIKNHMRDLGATEDQIQREYDHAMDEMILCLPTKEELLEAIPIYDGGDVIDFLDKCDFISDYYDYLQNWEDEKAIEDFVEMTYDEKSTEIQILAKNHIIVPLPLCTYAEISVRDFLDMHSDLKQGAEFFLNTHTKSNYRSSFREFWVDFDEKAYHIQENVEFKQPKNYKRIGYRIQRKLKRLENTKMSIALKEAYDSFMDVKSITDRILPNFTRKVCKQIKQHILETKCSRYIAAKKMKMKVLKKKKLTQEERENRARLECSRILSLKERIENNNFNTIDVSVEDTRIPNLTPQELYSSILEKIPNQETQYVLEEVKVLCTNQSGNLQSAISI